MLKKFLNILVVFILSVSTGGVSVTRHYCGNSLMSTSFFSAPHKCCPGSCDKCHNEHRFSKITSEFTNTGDVHNFDVTLWHFPVFSNIQPLQAVTVSEIYPVFDNSYLRAKDNYAVSCSLRC